MEDRRAVLNGILWVLRTGAPWADEKSSVAGLIRGIAVRDASNEQDLRVSINCCTKTSNEDEGLPPASRPHRIVGSASHHSLLKNRFFLSLRPGPAIASPNLHD